MCYIKVDIITHPFYMYHGSKLSDPKNWNTVTSCPSQESVCANEQMSLPSNFTLKKPNKSSYIFTHHDLT